MRIHTDSLMTHDIYTAAHVAGATVEYVQQHGSRKRDHAFEVKLTGNSRRRPNGGSYGADRDAYAATWDQWGVFLGYLFALSPNMTIPAAYLDARAFHERTDDRFDLDYFPEGIYLDGLRARKAAENIVIPFPLSHDHRFVYAGSPRTFECAKPNCDARQTY